MTPQKVFVVAIEPVIDAAGTTETHLFCAEPWATSPTDVPANTPVRPYLQNAGTFKQELFSGARVTGAIRPSFGNITLANPAPTIGSEGPFDAWLGYGLSGAKVTVRWGRIGDAYPSQWETVYIAYVAGAIIDTSSVTMRLRDRSYLFDAPLVTDGFDGSGGLEGSGSVPKMKQFVAGSAGFIPPVLVDPIKQIYFVQSTGDGGLRAGWVGDPNEVSLWDVFENGNEITRASTDYASEAELLSVAPASGEVKFYWGSDSTWVTGWKNGPVYFRLGTPPVGELRCYAAGFATDDDHARWGAAMGSFTLVALAMRAGVDRDSISTANVSVQMAMVDDDTPFIDVMSGACLAYESWFGFTRLDQFRDGYLCDPEDDGIWYGIDWAGAGMGAAPAAQPTTSVLTITPDNGKELRREPVNGMEAPVWKVNVKARKTWPCPVNSGASDTMRDYLTRDPWWATFQGVSDTTLTANPGAITATVDIPYADFPNVFSRRLFLERYFVLFGGRRDLFTVTVPLETASLAINLHDVVTLEWPRLGLGGGVKCRVVSIFIDCSAAVPSMRLGLWTGDIGEFTGTVSMVPPGGAGATPVPSYTQIGRQRLAPITQFCYGTVAGVGGGGFAGYQWAVLAAIRQTAYGIAQGWAEVGKVLASDAAASDQFGSAVAISRDGLTMAIGAPTEDNAGGGDAGAVYIFTRSGSTWTEEGKLLASDGAASARFGNAVALSSDGDTCAIGSNQDSNSGGAFAGSVYIFTRSGSTWTEQTRLQASDAAASDNFGVSVALSNDGNTCAVGADREDNAGGADAGAVYVFTRSGSTWTEEGKLLASDGAAGDLFGHGVALAGDGDTCAIGAYYDNSGAGTYSGSAYIFTRSGSTWTEEDKLVASDSASNDFFGVAVALSESGDTCAVGAYQDNHGGTTDAGSVYVFTRSASVWSEQARLEASDHTAYDWFGASVSLSSSGDTCAIGANGDDMGASSNVGSLYVFTRAGSTWSQQTKLTASDGAADDNLGTAIAISGDGAIVCVGSAADDNAGGTDAGAVYDYRLE